MTPWIIICASLVAVDGDTLRCDGQLLRLLGSGKPNVVGIDTPELRSYKCPAEKIAAQKAHRRLSALIKGQRVTIIAHGIDSTPSRRPLVNVYMEGGGEIGKTLMREGYAREWRPGRKNDWCR
jgi:endonuclease YncB( thermonuclease family)